MNSTDTAPPAATLPPTPPLLQRLDALQVVLGLLIAGGIAVLFSRYGSDSNTAMEPQSIFRWIEIQWRNEDFRNNWIMLLVAAYVIYRKREELLTVPKRPSWIGFGVVAGALLLHVAGYYSQLPRISLMTVVGVAWGACYAIWGWGVAKALLFPAGYTLLCFTSYHLVHLTLRLRLVASQLAEVLLHGVGIEAIRRGTVIYSAAGGGFQFDVADACSGLRSLVVVTALAAPYAYFTLKGPWRQWALFILSVPLAMLANTLRIFTLALVAEWVGMDLAMALYHDFSGYLVFIIAIALLMSAGSLLETDWRTRWLGWKERVFSRT